ncbi:MAG: serine/threonine-protein kinase [bacterium]
MHDAHTLEVLPRPTPTTDSSEAAFARFDERTRRDAERSLSLAAFTYAVAYTLAFGTSVLIERAAPGMPLPPLRVFIVASISIASGIAMGIIARRGNLPPVRFEPLAVTFGVLASLGIAAGAHNWRAAIEQGVLGSGLWIGVWVISFPNLVTLCPRSVLRLGLLSALTFPVMYLVSLPSEGLPIIDGQPSVRAPIMFLAQLVIPILICTGIATFMAVRLFRLAHDVSRARRLGNYQLAERIGQGGMGEVWRAQHRLLARPAAVKLIRGGAPGSDGGPSETAVRRFEREARATAALTSPHTVALYDFGRTNEGGFYYVMELLEGMDFRRLVDSTGPLPSRRVIHLLRQALASLGDAHESGLVHRDIKPANLYLCRRGLVFDFVKVLDFGLVKGSPEGDPTRQLTVEGTASGTPGFMAPELAIGSPHVDERCDLYAVGCVAYWLLTGRLVFEGPNAVSILLQHAKESPVPPSQIAELPVDPELERLILDLLEKKPADRPSSAREVDRRLAAIETRQETWSQDDAERWWRAHLPHLTGSPVPAPALDPLATAS